MPVSRPAGARGMAGANALPRPSLAPLRVKLSPPRHPRRLALVVAAVGGTLTGAYLGWFRDSSFASVRKVEVSGLSTARADRLRNELDAAARHMTTLDVDAGALWQAVHGDPLVRSISADGDFPHTLRIQVTLNLPRALLSYDGRTVAVAGDGTLLRGLETGALPTIAVARPPGGERVGPGRARALVAVAAAAPDGLRSDVDSISEQPGQGIVARMHNGPLVIFGGGRRLASKWAAAAAVLANGSSAGASYIDVTNPADPVAGGSSISSSGQSDPSSSAVGGTAGTGGAAASSTASAAPAATLPTPTQTPSATTSSTPTAAPTSPRP